MNDLTNISGILKDLTSELSHKIPDDQMGALIDLLKEAPNLLINYNKTGNVGELERLFEGLSSVQLILLHHIDLHQGFLSGRN